MSAWHRGTKSKPMPGPHDVFGFLTTAPNAVVEPIHPKAMPVILTTDEDTQAGVSPIRAAVCHKSAVHIRCSINCEKKHAVIGSRD
jgi:hypothetical protein